ncbi:MAG: Rieske (2Fe-2S) protein [Nitrospinota bacterium]|nr:Rieske (2Fe-2S) protein [Nitrospinota bacterium]
MVKFVKVMNQEDLPIGKSAIISAGEKEIALFNYKGKYFAIDNKCLHKGASLGEGRIEEGVVICPNHEWRYNLNTGECPQNPYMKAKIYPVKVAGSVIKIGLETKASKKLPSAKESNAPPASLKFTIPTIQKPINPDEDW